VSDAGTITDIARVSVPDVPAFTNFYQRGDEMTNSEAKQSHGTNGKQQQAPSKSGANMQID
jgi:hypothetical protein